MEVDFVDMYDTKGFFKHFKENTKVMNETSKNIACLDRDSNQPIVESDRH